MSQLLIQSYLNQLADLRKVSGTHRESVVREAFKDLLKGWGKSHDLIFVPEYEIETPAKERRYVDGALLHMLRVPFGYWEAKDEKDDLDAEIETKFRRGYPQDNIVFEDSRTAVLIQNKAEIVRCAVDDVAGLEKLLKLFFSYERQEIAGFRKAVEQFKTDIPAVLLALREMIEGAEAQNPAFRKAAGHFLTHAKQVINPSLIAADVREMLIQHILTEGVFAAVFPDAPFHSDNNVARELYKLESTFFTGNTKYKTLKALEPYYTAIRAAATQIGSHHEKQSFLKAIYENFYKVYNAKAADRLGVVYTPNEIVRFMIEGANWLCEQNFKRSLIDPDVDILDPATGTGTFICELLEYFRGQPQKLKRKYQVELHANEVAILPYYVANLNIEATYAAIAGEYLEFPNLCFVDTIDNTTPLRKYKGHMDDLFGAVSEENVERIRRQNSRRISVIIGNPPYNANQLNENENNKNREYPEIDKRIKETYIKASTAQKTKLYDMYARFFRWASDRLDENGVLAFITNRSFIDSRTFDGFRKTVAAEFNQAWIVDLGGDVRANPKLSGTKHNVFGIQTGVAISFFVKKTKTKGCTIRYIRRPELETAEDKLAFLGNTHLNSLKFETVEPDKKHNWLNLTDNDFDSLIPIASKETKASKKPAQEKAIFRLFSLGVVTARDDWVYDLSETALEKKVRNLITFYNGEVDRLAGNALPMKLADKLKYEIKWTRAVKKDLEKQRKYKFDVSLITKSLYRPFCKKHLYFSKHLNEMQYQQRDIFGWELPNQSILIDMGRKTFSSLAAGVLPDYHVNGDSICFPLYRYDDQNNRVDNITDWALEKFRKQYPKGRGKAGREVTKEDIFHYVYAVLHDPAYREKYALNLKREFPRLPFYADFWQWAAWGRALMELHIGYESVSPWKLKRVDVPDAALPKAMLKADRENGQIIIDGATRLLGIPPEAWDYKLGNRSALEWILDQYKEKKPKDPTIREKFNTYRFADYKEQVIDLLARVTRVSVETVAIIGAMKDAAR